MAAPDRTHYDVLGIARDADAAAVRTAWKLHVQAWHPDRFGEDLRTEAERQTTAINEAYSVLRDSSRRAAYDCRLAADEAAARPEPVRRAARPAASPLANRAPAAPVGSPLAPPRAPQTLSEQLAEVGTDAWTIVRRHPKSFAVAACTLLALLGGSIVWNLASAPTLPSERVAEPVSAIVASPEQVEDLEELAERAREEAAETDQQLQAMMAEDARIAAQEAAAAEREAQVAAAAQARQQKQSNQARPGSSSGAASPRSGSRIVRVMPRVQ